MIKFLKKILGFSKPPPPKSVSWGIVEQSQKGFVFYATGKIQPFALWDFWVTVQSRGAAIAADPDRLGDHPNDEELNRQQLNILIVEDILSAEARAERKNAVRHLFQDDAPYRVEVLAKPVRASLGKPKRLFSGWVNLTKPGWESRIIAIYVGRYLVTFATSIMRAKEFPAIIKVQYLTDDSYFTVYAWHGTIVRGYENATTPRKDR